MVSRGNNVTSRDVIIARFSALRGPGHREISEGSVVVAGRDLSVAAERTLIIGSPLIV